MQVPIFAYGTLKRGFGNHPVCGEVTAIEVGRVLGKLYATPYGFPALRVPQATVLAEGGGDLAADAALARQTEPVPWSGRDDDWQPVDGELIVLAHWTQLGHTDRLEGFRPEGGGMYHRVLVSVHTGTGMIAAWTYVSEDLCQRGQRVARWPVPEEGAARGFGYCGD